MSFLNKLGIGIGVGSETSRDISRPALSGARARTPGGTAAAAGAGSARAPDPRESTRVSNGLKEFLWNLDGLGRGTLLDLGPAWQTTLSFFIERGFRVSSEDILRGWKAFLTDDEKRLREDADARDKLDMTPSGRARRFLAENLQYPRATFDAVLLWDLLDYLEPLQVISSAVICPAQKVYQNREIQDLFGRFRTMKSFVGRDQLRETLFIK